MNCEKCNKEHDGKFGSGRFCSRQCANSRTLPKETYLEISRKLKIAKPMRYVEITCAFCGKVFETEFSCRTKKHCSYSCAIAPGQYHWKVKDSSKMGGPRDGGGKSTVYEYINWLGHKMHLNNHEIRLAKVLDEEKFNWSRNLTGFQYVNLKGKSRKFYPDFYIKNFDLYVEYKGWITNEMKHKMEDALSKNDFNLLIIYSDDKRYENLGLSISAVENNRNLLRVVSVTVAR